MRTTELTAHDTDALSRALRLMLANKKEREHFESILKQYGWQEAAIRASYCAQIRALRLKPWQSPPCEDFGDEVANCYGHREAEVALRRRMRAHGISLFEPNPIAALAAAEAKPVDVA
jgi:hypothetical protein